MKTYEDLANYIFPEITETIADLEAKYPARKLPEGAEVTRFAPSPTGFLHLGSLFTSLVAHKVAKDTNGVFYLRLEDTDTKREVEGSGDELVRQLAYFGIDPKEGYLDKDVGDYVSDKYYIQGSVDYDLMNYIVDLAERENAGLVYFWESKDFDEDVILCRNMRAFDPDRIYKYALSSKDTSLDICLK